MRKTMYYLIMIVDAMMVINLLVNVFFFFFSFDWNLLVNVATGIIMIVN